MLNARPSAPQWAGLALLWLGGVAAARWIFGLDGLARAIPAFTEIGIVAPILFLCAGTALLLLGRAGERPLSTPAARGVVACCLAVLVTFPLLMLIEQLAGAMLGADIVHAGIQPTAANPFPGRMSPNACAAFLLGAIALIVLGRDSAPLHKRFVSLAALLGTTALGVAGCAGYFLRLEVLYTHGAANRLTLPVAYGLVCFGVGLWFLREQSIVQRATFEGHETRITQRSIAVIALVALAAGVGGFATIEQSFEEIQSHNLVVTATTHAHSLAAALESGLRFTRTFATRPTVTQTLARLAQHPQDAAARDSLQNIADGVASADITTVRFVDSDGTTLATSGAAPAAADSFVLALALATQDAGAKLLWRDGYLLHVEVPIVDHGRQLGRVITEQRLTLFDRLLASMRDGSASSDALVCAQAGDLALCGPSRFRARAFTLPLRDAKGQPSFAMVDALTARHDATLTARPDAVLTHDLRGVLVLAAVVPVGGFGLGLVVKTDADGLYAPLRERLGFLGLLLLIVAAAGSFALRTLVKPLVDQVVNAQRRTHVILENSNDAFIGLGADGTITDWNGEAQRTFGWAPEEAIGRDLAALVIPEDQREAHNAGMARFRRSGAGPLVNKRIEVTALHRDGHRFTAELSIASFFNGAGYVAHAFVRDITARLAAQEELATSEKRLQAITDNLPVLIAYIDRERRIAFINETLASWTGKDPASAVGASLQEVIGVDLYGQRAAHLDQALRGARVEFEWTFSALGVTRNVQTIYIPDMLPDGSVAGVYSLSSDVTSSKLVERRLEQLARIDTLTGLPNRREFEERLASAMARSRRSGRPMALIFLDVDRFKDVNDTHGHGVGDAVLKEFASRIAQSIRATDTAAHLAGDEFVVILEGLNDAAEGSAVSAKLGGAIREPMQIAGRALTITASLGYAFYEGHGGSAEALVARADRALYRAKAAGRDTFAATTF